jgi:hypothetical protein
MHTLDTRVRVRENGTRAGPLHLTVLAATGFQATWPWTRGGRSGVVLVLSIAHFVR